MGGKALGVAGVQSIRLAAREYQSATTVILDQLRTGFPEAKFTLVPAYANKADFGDADVLVSCEPVVWENLLKSLDDLPKYKNGKVFSYGHMIDGKYFQVDLIYCGATEEEMTTELHYYGFNDLGNLVGRLAHTIGFKYGHKGLAYMLRAPSCREQVIADLHVTCDTKTIHGLLGLDHERFKQGFDELEDIFQWIAASKYFHPRIYLLENVNAVSRIRDAKRKTYNAFLEWSAALDDSKFVDYNDGAKESLRGHTLYEMLTSHREFAIAYNDAMAKFHKKDLAAQFFNGELVKELTGLEGKELGIFMKRIKEKLTTDVVVADPNSVVDVILGEYEIFKNQ